MKKPKRLKDEFKGRKKAASSGVQADIGEVKKRVLDSLEHLGHQKFSAEPGGYDLHGWVKGLKTSLDDFEEKVGAGVLPEEYHSKRKQLEEDFSKPIDTSKVDEEVEAIRREETDIRAKLEEETRRVTARLVAISSDKDGKSKELDVEKIKLKNAQEEKKSASFFSKLMGRGGPEIEPFEKKVTDLEKGLKMLEEEALNLQTVKKSLEGIPGERALHDGLWSRLESIGNVLKELEDTKQIKLQLAKEREEGTEALRKIISELKFEPKKEEWLRPSRS